ncbi:MAG: hypothetical protein OXD32_07385, partial [Endozoicomonadaceae bacterium]|nr:hypothetical protein [Endozoicomonadaceae bacterium]
AYRFIYLITSKLAQEVYENCLKAVRINPLKKIMQRLPESNNREVIFSTVVVFNKFSPCRNDSSW